MAPTNPSPKIAHPSECQTAETRRVRATGPYHCSHAARRSSRSRGAMPVTRTSLAGGAVVAVWNRCSASRRFGAPASSTSRSTPGRQDDVATVGTAKSAEQQEHRADGGEEEHGHDRARRIQPAVENTAMYMWSRTKTWSRRIDSRSR